jgi:hypothetical protein
MMKALGLLGIGKRGNGKNLFSTKTKKASVNFARGGP